MCHNVLTQLHDSHQNIVRTKERARIIVYWPGLKNDINVILSYKPANMPYPPITKNLSHKNLAQVKQLQLIFAPMQAKNT